MKKRMNYMYVTKKTSELEIGDIVFNEVDEDNIPLYKYVILSEGKEDGYKLVYCLEENQLRELDFSDFSLMYFLGNASLKLSTKELMKNVQKRYVWMGIEYDLNKVLVNLLDGNVEKYNYDTESWEFLNEEVEDNGYMMLINLGEVRFRINLTNLKVQIANTHTLRFRNYNNFLLGLEGEFVFNADNELELLRPPKTDSGKEE